MANHLATNHSLTNVELASLPDDFAYDREIGNDDIQADSGNDLVVGDFGAYAFPILTAMPTTTAEISTAEQHVGILTSGLADWLESQHHSRFFTDRIAVQRDASNADSIGYEHPLYDQRGSARWSLDAGKDTINAGADDDFVLGDSYYVSTNVVANDSDARFSESENQFKLQHLDREDFELTLHYNRLSNPSTDPAAAGQSPFGNDTIFGGDGDDRLFGQFQDDDLFGDAGTDFLFGGDGDNTVDGGGGGGNELAGSTPGLELSDFDRLEDYQFGLRPLLVTNLSDDVANANNNAPNDLTFSYLVGNFVKRD